MEMFYKLPNVIAKNHMGLLRTWKVSSASEELNFHFYLILINLNGHMGLVATILDSAVLNFLHPFPAEVMLDGNISLVRRK